MKEEVRITRTDGTEVSFAAHRAGWRELTPAQKVRLERLFAWCESEDRKYAAREAARKKAT